MANYSRLNKAEPIDKFEVVFDKQKQLNEAILELIRTAYLNHHLETDKRNIKLYECLEQKAKFVIDQLQDDEFVSNFKKQISNSIDQNLKVKSFDKSNIISDISKLIEKKKKEIESQISEKHSNKTNNIVVENNTKIDSDIINKVLLNDQFIQNVQNFSLENIKKNNNDRKSRLENVLKNTKFNNISKISQQKIPLQDRIISNKTTKINIVQKPSIFKRKILTQILTKPKKQYNLGKIIDKKLNKIYNKINIVFNTYTKNLISKDEYKNRISNVFYIKNVSDKKHNKTLKNKKSKPKFKFGFTSIINFLFKGWMKIVGGIIGGIFSITFGVIKAAFKVFKFAVKTIFVIAKNLIKICGKIIVGLGKLIPFSFKFFKYVLSTPQGMYYTGFVIGFIYGKIKQKWNSVKEFYDKVIQKIKDIKLKVKITAKKIIFGGIKFWVKHKNIIKTLIDVVKSIPQVTRDFFGKFETIDDFLKMLKGTAITAGGTMLGAVIGRIVGSALIPICGSLGPGAGTALGAIAGMLITEYLQKIPEKTNSKIGQIKLLSDINKRYRNLNPTKSDIIKKRVSALDVSIGDIDRDVEKLKNDKENSEQNQKKINELLEKKKKLEELRSRLKGDNGFKTIDFEDDEEKKKNDELIHSVLGNLDKIYNTTHTKFDNSIFKPFETIGVSNFDIDKIISENKYISNSKSNNSLVLGQIQKIITDVQKLKAQAIHQAINKYYRGLIPFSKIGEDANKSMNRIMKEITVSYNAGENKVPYTQYIKEFKDGRYGNIVQKNIFEFMPKWEDDALADREKKSKLSIEYADKYIENLKNLGVTLSKSQTDEIYSLFNRMIMSSNANSKWGKKEFQQISDTIRQIVFENKKETGEKEQQQHLDIFQNVLKQMSDAAKAINTTEDIDKNMNQQIDQMQIEQGIEIKKKESNEIENLKKQKVDLQNIQNDLLSKVSSLDRKKYEQIILNETKKGKDIENDPNAQNNGGYAGPYAEKQDNNIVLEHNPLGSQILNGSYW